MKMFLAVFFAILAAAAVIFVVLLAKSKIDARQQRAIAEKMRVHERVQFDIQMIKTQLHLFASLSGFLPTTDQGLQALVTQPQNDPRSLAGISCSRNCQRIRGAATTFIAIPAGKIPKPATICIRQGPTGKPTQETTIGVAKTMSLSDPPTTTVLQPRP